MQEEINSRIPKIILDHLTFSYRDGTEGLRDVSLNIYPNEIMTLFGPAGGGSGRGSGAGSLVAYCLGITELDPIKYDLLFERFLNPERVSLPDFDVDFCIEGRDRVIEYVAGRYGRERVSQIITYGTMAAKAVVRDVARVLGHSYGFADSIAKLIPFELGITLDDALAKEEERVQANDARAAFQRSPPFCVTWYRPTPSWTGPLKSSFAGSPASFAASTNRRAKGLGERRSATFSGPPVPCSSLAPRSLFSERRKYGSTSRQAQPVAPAAAQSS